MSGRLAHNDRNRKPRPLSAHEEVRRRCGYTVTGLARELGFSHAYVSLVEGGKKRPSERYRRAVARLLRVPETLLFPESEEPRS